LLLAPRPERVSRCLFSLLLQFVNAIGQIAEAGQYSGAVAVGGPASVLSESDVPPIMGAVFNGRPMAANEAEYGGRVMLLEGQAAGVVADFQRGRFLGLMVILGVALHRDNLPATAQSDLFRADGNPGNASVIKASVFLLPKALRGENPAEPAGVGLYPGPHFGYP